MLAKDVRIGYHYIARVSGKRTTVRILYRDTNRGGWAALNVKTDREVHIRTAARLSKPPRLWPHKPPLRTEKNLLHISLMLATMRGEEGAREALEDFQEEQGRPRDCTGTVVDNPLFIEELEEVLAGTAVYSVR